MTKRVEEFIANPRSALYKLAIPTTIGMLVQTLYNVVDTAYVGRLGADAIAALTFAFPLFFVLIAFNAGIGAGMGSRISRELGAKNLAEAENTASHGLLLSVLAAILVFLIGIFSLDFIFEILGAEGLVKQLAVGYTNIVMFGALFMFVAFTISSIFSAQGDTKMPMKVQIVGLVANIILDPIFIYSLGFGTKGAAIATTVAFFFALLLSLYYLRTKSHLHIEKKNFHFSWKIIMEIFRVGAPAAFATLLISFYIIFLNIFMAYFGIEYVAAFGIATRLESVAMLPVIGFSLGLLTLSGMFYGAKRYDLLRGIIWYSIKVSTFVVCIIGFIFFIASALLLRIFTPDAMLIEIASKYLRIDVFTFPLMAIIYLISRALQGMGSGFPSLLINITRIFVFALPLAYLFVFILGYGYLSIAVAMLFGGIAASLTSIVWLEIKLHQLNGEVQQEI